MIRETVKINLTKEYKEKAMNIINNNIKMVADRYDYELSTQEERKIKNMSLDQVNINVSQKNKSKTIWIFDAEDSMPVIVEKEEPNINTGLLMNLEDTSGAYLMRPNLTWTFNKKNLQKGGLTRREFEEENLKILLEDFETASFYGALSYITERDIDEI